MMNPFRQHFRLIIFSFLICTTAPTGVAQDRVFPKQGSPVQGSISKLNASEVVISVRGKEQTHLMKDVKKISFDKEPSNLDRIRDMAMDGKYQPAIDALKAIQRDSLPENALLRQDYDFLLWYCEGSRSLAGTGDQNSAIKALMSFDKSYPDSQHLYSVKKILGRLATVKKAYDKAIEYFSELAKSSDDAQKAAGIYYLAKVRLIQGKPDQAKEQLKSLLSATASSPEMGRFKSLAGILDARCDIEKGNAELALKALDALALQEDNTDFWLFAELNNARGAAYRKLGDDRRAAYSYLQTDLLFFTDPESHAEALFNLKQLLMTVGQPAKAADAGERLSTMYASSGWANQ